MYKQTIPRYICVCGVWGPNFGDGITFTKKDVKQIYIDHNIMCVIVLLKDGTKICPDCVSADNDELLEIRLNNWIGDILHLKKALPTKQRTRHKYSVYSLEGNFIGETSAASQKDAINHVRYRNFGYQGSNDCFFAIRSDGRGNEADEDGLFWYVVEFSVMNCDEYEFDPTNAHYEIVHNESMFQAKENIEYEYLKIEDDKCSFVNICFGRISEFISHQDAILCAKEWMNKN